VGRARSERRSLPVVLLRRQPRHRDPYQPRLTSLGRKHIVWRAPDRGPVSREVWAPELHFLDGKWHIYFAASDGKNENHLAYVLVSEDSDPLGKYTLHGPWRRATGPANRSGRST
jgi:hypothetical protein